MFLWGSRVPPRVFVSNLAAWRRNPLGKGFFYRAGVFVRKERPSPGFSRRPGVTPQVFKKIIISKVINHVIVHNHQEEIMHFLYVYKCMGMYVWVHVYVCKYSVTL